MTVALYTIWGKGLQMREKKVPMLPHAAMVTPRRATIIMTQEEGLLPRTIIITTQGRR